MLYNFLFLALGILAGVAIDWLRLSKEEFENAQNIKKMVVSAFLCLIASYFLRKAHLDGWLLEAILVAIGFLFFHVIRFAIKKRS